MYILNVILSYSILFAAILAILKYKRISRDFYPFIYCIWVGTIAEGLSTLIYSVSIKTHIHSNIYILAEALLFLTFFYRVDTITLGLYKLIFGFIVLFYLIDLFLLEKYYYLVSYFRIAYSLILVLLSIRLMNNILVDDRTNVFTSSEFIISSALILFYTYNILVHSFWKVFGSYSNDFLLRIYSVKMYINFLSNFLYFYAIICIPSKKGFTLYS